MYQHLYRTHNSKGFSQLFITLRITGFFLIHPSSDIIKYTIFRKEDLFPSSGEGRGHTYSVGSVRKY
jgi:hypothetical protein